MFTKSLVSDGPAAGSGQYIASRAGCNLDRAMSHYAGSLCVLNVKSVRPSLGQQLYVESNTTIITWQSMWLIGSLWIYSVSGGLLRVSWA